MSIRSLARACTLNRHHRPQVENPRDVAQCSVAFLQVQYRIMVVARATVKSVRDVSQEQITSANASQWVILTAHAPDNLKFWSTMLHPRQNKLRKSW
jgi:hypothetical protein